MAFLAKDLCLRLERNCNFVANSADYILMLKNDLFVSWIKRENIAKQALGLILASKASKNTNIKIDICI
jgi:hypothetical protein